MKLKKWIVNFWKGVASLNWELILGVVLIAPSIFYGFKICEHSFGSSQFEMNVFDLGQVQRTIGDVPDEFSAVPIYLGLLAIAGAYLIKGNLRKSQK